MAETNTTSGAVTNAQEWSGTITLTGDITIVAGGAVTVDAGTIVQSAAGDDTGGGLDPSRVEIIVAGGSLTVNGTINRPVFFTTVSTNTVPGGWYGLEYQSGSLTLEQAVIACGVNGLTMTAGGTNSFSDCTITNCSQNGVVVSAPGSFTFEDFQLLGNGQCGLTAPSGTTSVSLTGGLAMNNGSHNVSCAGNVSAAGFQSENAGGWGIAAGSVVLNDCVVINNTSGGVTLGGFTTSTANNCTLNGNHGAGLYANNGDTLVLSGCQLMNNAGDGINAAYSPENANMTLTACNLNGNGGSGINAAGGTVSGNLALTGCDLNDNGSFGILANSTGYGWTVSGTVTSCQTVGNGQYDLENSGTGTIFANDDYWGPFTTAQLQSGVTCPSRIYDYCDNSAVGQVLIQRYSTSSTVGAAPTITLQPVSVALPPGQTATFSVIAVGSQPLSYQWQFNGANLADNSTFAGSQTDQLSVTNVAPAEVGSYQVVVSNSVGAVTSQVAALTIGYPPPTVTLVAPHQWRDIRRAGEHPAFGHRRLAGGHREGGILQWRQQDWRGRQRALQLYLDRGCGGDIHPFGQGHGYL